MVNADGIPLHDDTYKVLLTACQRSGHKEDALRIFQSLVVAGFKADHICYNNLISACAKGMDWAMAEEVFIAMEVSWY